MSYGRVDLDKLRADLENDIVPISNLLDNYLFMYRDMYDPQYLDDKYALVVEPYANRINQFPPDLGTWLKERNVIAVLIGHKWHVETFEFLPDDLDEWESVEVFKIESESLESLPDTLGKMRNLRVLNINNIRISSLPDLSGLNNLEHLSLDHIPFDEFPESIVRLPKLRTLKIMDTDPMRISSRLYQAKSLTSMFFKKSIEEFPEQEDVNHSVKEIKLRMNSISDIDGICQFQGLEKLDIQDNKLQYLPEQIGELGQLVELKAGSNRIENIPETLGNLSNMKHLSLGRNEISHVPDTIQQLHRLEILHLYTNNLNNFPNITELTNLKELKIGGNKLTNIDFIPEGTELPNLTVLWLYDNNITFLNKSVFSQIDLEILVIGSNQINLIPPSICQLRNLEMLNFSKNNITEFPYAKTEFPKLKKLNVEENQLSSIDFAYLELEEFKYEGNPQLEEKIRAYHRLKNA